MEKIINWGIIGLGNAALNLAKEFDKIGNSKLLAVASLTQKKREFFKRRFNLLNQNIYSTYNEIFNNKDIDIIFISLPNSMHEEFCIKAIQNNKNVLVEKPITTNLESLKNIKRLFLKKNLILEEGTANKFHPFYKQVLNKFKNLDYTKIINIKSSFGNDALGGKKIFGIRLKKINHNKRLFNKKLGGGSILDGGIYPASLFIDLLCLHQIKFSKNFKVLNCKKKLTNNVDLSSTLEVKINNFYIQLETSLIEPLKNNFEVKMSNETIIIENIFNISSESKIIIKKNGMTETINNNFKNTSYFYEIKKISKMLIENSSDKRKKLNLFSKIEKNMALLDIWLKN